MDAPTRDLNLNGPAGLEPLPRPTREEAMAAVRTLIAWAGDDPRREGVIDTPKRVVDAYADWFEGYGADPAKELSRTFEDVQGYDDIVMLREIEVESHCEHHMAPFLGKAYVAYMPTNRVVGISKLARVVEIYAKRLQTQETMTQQIADAITDDDVVTVDSTSETITMVRTCRNKAVAPIMAKAAGITAKTQNVRFTIHIYLRSHVAAIYSRSEPGLDVRLLHCSTPETRDSNTVNFIQNTREARMPYRVVSPLASYKIGPQDDYALRPQGPRYHHEIARRDLHSRFDVASVRYRHLVGKLLGRQSRGDYSYEADDIISADKSAILGIGRPV